MHLSIIRLEITLVLVFFSIIMSKYIYFTVIVIAIYVIKHSHHIISKKLKPTKQFHELSITEEVVRCPQTSPNNDATANYACIEKYVSCNMHTHIQNDACKF